MNSIKKTFVSLALVAVMVISLFCGAFTQTVFAATIKAKSTMMHAEVYSVISRLKPDGTIELISEGPVTNGTELSATIEASEQVCFVFFGKPEKGYLITGVGTTGKNNISHISELDDPEKRRLRTEGKVPEDILQRMKEAGYLFAWGYTRGGTNGTNAFADNVNGFKPAVYSSITNTSGDIEPGKPVTMKVVIKPDKAFRDGNDKRKYWTDIPAGEATITIDGKRVIPVTDIEKKSENLYEGNVTFVLSDEDASVNTHTAVVNANVHYTSELALTSATGSYRGEPVKTTTVVEVPPATVNFSLVANTKRKLTYDLGYEGVEEIPAEIYNSGDSVTVNSKNYVRENYEFIGWKTINAEGNEVILQPADTFTMPDRVTGTKLVAKWRTKLTVKSDNGSEIIKSMPEIGSKVTPDKPIKEGYIFLGWKDSDGKVYDVDEEIVMPDKPLELKAIWKSKQQSLPSTNSQAVSVGSAIYTEPSAPSVGSQNISETKDAMTDSDIEKNNTEQALEKEKAVEKDKTTEKEKVSEKLSDKKNNNNAKSEKKNTSDSKQENKTVKKAEAEKKNNLNNSSDKKKTDDINSAKKDNQGAKADKNHVGNSEAEGKNAADVTAESKNSVESASSKSVSPIAGSTTRPNNGINGKLNNLAASNPAAANAEIDKAKTASNKKLSTLNSSDLSNIPLSGTDIKTLPVTGGRVNVEFWLGLSILSTLGVYKLLEAKRKKVKKELL